MATDLRVAGEIDDYGSTQDADIIVPLTMVMENHSQSLVQKTTTATRMVLCLLGLTAAAVVLSLECRAVHVPDRVFSRTTPSQRWYVCGAIRGVATRCLNV